MRLTSLKRYACGSALLLLLAFTSTSGCGRTSAPTRATASPPAPIARPQLARHFGYAVGGKAVASGQAILHLDPGVDIATFAGAHHLTVLSSIPFGNETCHLVSSEDDPSSVALPAALQNESGVDWVLHNTMVWAPEGDQEPMATDDGDGWRTAQNYTAQEAVYNLMLSNAHGMATGSGVRVAILDTGLDPSCPIFTTGGPVELGLSYVSDFPLPYEGETQDGLDSDHDGYKDEACGHGTHVAGIVRLAAPDARIIAIQVLDDDGWGTSWGVSQGIVEAVENHSAQVINLSLGLLEDNPLIRGRVEWAIAQGVIVVASAGNRASRVPQYPAAWPGVISVTSVDGNRLATFANTHSTVAVSAPGVDVVSAIPGKLNHGAYAVASGGSAAAPWVSACAALMLEYSPGLGPADVVNFMKLGSTDISAANPGVTGMGVGRINLFNALRSIEWELEF